MIIKLNNNKYELKKVFRWGGIRTYIIIKNDIEIDQLAPNLNTDIAIKQFNEFVENENIKSI